MKAEGCVIQLIFVGNYNSLQVGAQSKSPEWLNGKQQVFSGI